MKMSRKMVSNFNINANVLIQWQNLTYFAFRYQSSFPVDRIVVILSVENFPQL